MCVNHPLGDGDHFKRYSEMQRQIQQLRQNEQNAYNTIKQLKTTITEKDSLLVKQRIEIKYWSL